MPVIPYISFSAGEISPEMFGRVDHVKCRTGLERCRNFQTRLEGSVENRPGSAFVCPLDRFANTNPTYIPFVFNDDQAYQIVLHWNGAACVGIILKNGSPVFEATTWAITGISLASPMVVTSVAHGLANDDFIYIDGVNGTVQADKRFYRVANDAVNSFSCSEESGVDSSAFDAWTSGGTIYRVYKITGLPYSESELQEIRVKQSGDVLFLTHPNHPVQLVSRLSETNWTVEDAVFEPAIGRPQGGTGSGTGGGDTVRYRVTAIDQDTLEESYPGVNASVSVTAVAETIPDATVPITGATNANPVVVTSVAHGKSNGDLVLIAAVGGMTELNGRYFKLANVAANTFELQDEDGINVDGTAYGVYTAGGTAQRTYRYLVTTGAAHGLVDNDEVIMTGIVTYTELNNVLLTVDVITTTTFRVNKKYGDSTASVAQAGTVVRTAIYIPSVAFPTASNPITISWTAVSGALEYNIYREINGIYGYVGTSAATTFEDLGYTVDPLDTPPVNFTVFSESDQYPTAVGFYQQSLILGGPNSDPERIRKSRAGLYFNFSKSNPVQSDDAISWIMASGQVNGIRHFADMGKLLVFTQGSVHSIEGDDAGSVTPTAINPRLRAEQGTGDLPPLVVGDTILFVQSSGVDSNGDLSSGRIVRELIPETNGSDRYQSNDLTVFSKHLLEDYGILHWTFAETPSSIVWLVREDGVMLGATYMRQHQLLGWHRHDTGDGDLYTDVSSIPESGRSATYCATRRYDCHGNTRTYLERFAERDAIKYKEDGRFLDCFTEYENANEDAGAFYTLDYSSGWTLTASGTTAAFTTGEDSPDIGRKVLVYGPNGERAWCTILSITSTTVAAVHVFVNPDSEDTPVLTSANAPTDDFPIAYPLTTAEWSSSVTEITSLWHLEGREVYALGDGFPQGPYTVTNGAITLDSQSVIIIVGLQIIAEIATLEPDDTQGQSWAASDKEVGEVAMRVVKTLGVSMGLDGTSYQDFSPKWTKNSRTFDGLSLYSGRLLVKNKLTKTPEGRVYIRQDKPLPCKITGIYVNIRIGEG